MVDLTDVVRLMPNEFANALIDEVTDAIIVRSVGELQLIATTRKAALIKLTSSKRDMPLHAIDIHFWENHRATP